MDVREKLVELIVNSPGLDTLYGKEEEFAENADWLISHGVTVQDCGQWEDDHGDYVCSCCHTVFTDEIVWLIRGESVEPNYCPKCGAKMMPQPPKGE